MKFRKEERTFQTPPGWRLATVEEARKHVESIKSLMTKWDTARLLDGWIGGSGYGFKAHVGFRSCVRYMLLVPLVECPQQGEIVEQDNMEKCPYSEATLFDREAGRSLVDEKGMRVALFLCCEDWNYEVICWLLNYWSKSNGHKVKITKDMQSSSLFQEIKHTSDLFNKAARHLQNTLQVLRWWKNPTKIFSDTYTRAMTLAFIKNIRNNTTDYFLKKKLDDVNLADIGSQIWKEMNNPASFLREYFDTSVTLTSEAVTDIIEPVVAIATGVRIIRSCILEKNKNIYEESLKGEGMDDLAFVSSIVVHTDRLLDSTIFGYNTIREELQRGAKATRRDYSLFGEMLLDQGYGTFSYDGRHGILNTILVQAAKEGEIKLLKRLIECGVRPLDTDDRKQKTALHHAAKLENEFLGAEIAKELLKGLSSELLANAKDYKGRTPLHRAASCGHAQVCGLLLEHKSDVLSKDGDGQIPLYYALRCETKNEEVINVLIMHYGMDAKGNNLQVDWKDNEGKTPLDLALDHQGIKILAWLLSLSTQPKVYFKKFDLGLCLRESSAKGYEALVKKLLQAGADPLESDQEGKTALHCAVGCQTESQALKVVRELRKYKHNMKLVTICDKYGRSVLHVAAFVGHKELCKLLLSIDAVDIDREDRDGRRALHYAAAGTHDDDKLLDVLTIEGSTNIAHLKDFRGTTPLQLAAATGKVKMVGKLLSETLIPKAKDLEKYVRAADVIGQTALHRAASGGHTRVVQILLEKGAHPLNERDCDGKTALHYAAQAEKSGKGEDAFEIGKLLLKKCNFEEKSLLLFASAVGIGSADDSLESISKLKTYLVKEKHTIKNKLKQDNNNLLRVAATLGNIDMLRELLTRGANIADIRSNEWRDTLKDITKEQNVKKVLKQIDHIIEQGTDKPARQDNLGRLGFAKGLAALFLNPFVKSPITVGISGEWGMGKSSVMAQTESILLKTSAYVAFSNQWQNESFPGAKEYILSPKGATKLKRIKNSIKQLNQNSSKQLSGVKKIIMHLFSTPVEESDQLDELDEFLKNDQPQYQKVLKSLAAMDRKDLFAYEYQKGEEEGTIPSILTVRYNAWEYRNESEAWAGLAVGITKELEAAMPMAQRLYSSWRYNWKYNKHKIWKKVIFPCLLVIIVAVWLTIIVWFLLERAPRKFKKFKYGSFPITLLLILGAGLKSAMSVVKPISSQMVDYICLPDHSGKLGYQQQVIEDINFLKDEALTHRPSKLWWGFALIWSLITFSRDERYIHSKTRMPKMTPASKDQLRMVVFVDDLDRCEESVILKILSAINLVLAVCKIDVILGMDKSLIERAVRRKYEDTDAYPSESSEDVADKYLKKIVQLPLDLPDPSHFESRKFLQGHLGMLDTSDTDTDAAPPKKEKMNPTFRIGRRIPSPDTAGGADSNLYTLGESSQCLQGEQLHIVIQGEDKGKEKPTLENIIPIEMMIPKYTEGEGKAFQYLQTKATGSRKLPREWKRLLNYHRLAWNILSKRPNVTKLDGWQVQLIGWIFVCWEWKDQINILILKWHNLDVLKYWKEAENIGPSLREIVEEYMDGRWKKDSAKQHSLKLKEKDSSEEEELEDRLKRRKGRKRRRIKQVLAEEKEQDGQQNFRGKECDKGKRIVVSENRTEHSSLKQLKENKEKEREEVKEAQQEEEKEREEWIRLSKTLSKYNVSMDGIQAFQKFRFYCMAGYLPWPLLNE